MCTANAKLSKIHCVVTVGLKQNLWPTSKICASCTSLLLKMAWIQWTACLAWWGVPRLAFWCRMGIRVLRMQKKCVTSFSYCDAECHLPQLHYTAWRKKQILAAWTSKCSAAFFLTILSAVTPSQFFALYSGISGWLPRPLFHPPSSNTEAATRRSLPSGTLWGVWMTEPAKSKIVDKFYKMKSFVTYIA